MKQADCSLDDVSAPILMRFKSYFFLETTGSISWHPSGQELVKSKEKSVRERLTVLSLKLRLPGSTAMFGRAFSNCELAPACWWFLVMILKSGHFS